MKHNRKKNGIAIAYFYGAIWECTRENYFREVFRRTANLEMACEWIIIGNSFGLCGKIYGVSFPAKSFKWVDKDLPIGMRDDKRQRKWEIIDAVLCVFLLQEEN